MESQGSLTVTIVWDTIDQTLPNCKHISDGSGCGLKLVSHLES